jgi:heptosyltransferase II
MKKLLIIKLGYSETLDNKISLVTSLGDVLRATVLLHFFKGYRVSWLVAAKARPLLEKNRYIDKIYDYGPEAIFLLKNMSFDLVVNLEKLPEVCSFAESLPSKHYLGFRLNKLNGLKVNFLSGNGLIKIPQDLDEKKDNKDCWQKIIAASLGKKWRGQGYILGYQPRSKIKYDVGFNWTVGNKWPNKAWPRNRWEKLEDLIKEKYSISWQQGLNSLDEYIDWINSCKLIVTADTLGLHICLALRKKVIALFGPTSYREMHFYNCGPVILSPAPYNCLPCFKSLCNKKRQCMDFIDPVKVSRKIEDELKNHKITRKL